MTIVVTEGYERQVWNELNSRLLYLLPEEASNAEAEDTVLFAVMGLDAEAHELYEQIKRMARDRACYLRERLEEDNPISRVRRRLYGDRA